MTIRNLQNLIYETQNEFCKDRKCIDCEINEEICAELTEVIQKIRHEAFKKGMKSNDE